MPVFADPPALMGHRGFGKNAEGRPQENTAESFRAAVDAGVDWIELDIRRTADDELVLLHEAAWDDGTLVVTHTAAELSQFGIITLDEALAAIPNDVGVNIEIKSSLEDALVPPASSAAALLCPVLEREHAHRPLLASSFEPTALQFIRSHVPDVAIGYISWLGYPLDMAVVTAKRLGAEVLMGHVRSYADPESPTRPSTERVIEVALEAGLELGAWAPDADEVADYAAAGIAVITVDDVPGGIAALGAERDAAATG
ncbi:MAG: glycerophosphodiester phosphodiesterase [Streptosporangiales bacterium]